MYLVKMVTVNTETVFQTPDRKLARAAVQIATANSDKITVEVTKQVLPKAVKFKGLTTTATAPVKTGKTGKK